MSSAGTEAEQHLESRHLTTVCQAPYFRKFPLELYDSINCDIMNQLAGASSIDKQKRAV